MLELEVAPVLDDQQVWQGVIPFPEDVGGYEGLVHTVQQLHVVMLAERGLEDDAQGCRCALSPALRFVLLNCQQQLGF